VAADRRPGGPRSWWLIAQKDWLMLSRDKMSLFFTLVFPLLMAIFFGTAFSGGSETARISLAVVDQDQTPAAREWLTALAESDALEMKTLPLAEARDQVRRGKVTAMLIIPKGFGRAREGVFDPLVPTVKLGVDPGQKAVAGMLEGLLMQQAARDMQDAISQPDTTLQQFDKNLAEWRKNDDADPQTIAALEELRQSLDVLLRQPADDATEEGSENAAMGGFTPLKIEKVAIQKTRSGPVNAYTVSFPQGIAWGVMSVLMAFALSLVTEKSHGTLARLLSLPISRGDVLSGKALGCFVTIMAVMVIILAVGVVVFGISIQSPLVLALAILSTAVGFTGLMMLLSVFSENEKQASGLVWPVMMVLAMFGGGMIPVMVMPRWMAALGDFSPVKWTILSLEGGLWRQFSLADAAPYLLLLSGFGVVTFLLGRYLFARKQIM
jgi:ABC-2 type transport system permease protein